MGIFCNFSCFSFDSPQLDVAESWEEVVIVVESGVVVARATVAFFSVFSVYGVERFAIEQRKWEQREIGRTLLGVFCGIFECFFVVFHFFCR